MKGPYRANINNFSNNCTDSEAESDELSKEEMSENEVEIEDEDEDGSEEQDEVEEDIELEDEEEDIELENEEEDIELEDEDDDIELEEEEDDDDEEEEKNEEKTSVPTINDDSNETVAQKKRKVTDVLDPPQKKKKKLEKELYKPPTTEELNQLRETENLFHSNLFRLQIEEVLNEIRIKDKYKHLFDTWFEKFQKTVKNIEETKKYQLSDLKLKENLNVQVPMPDVPEETKAVFEFLKPSNVAVIGSYACDATVGPNITIDVMVEMPAKMFQKSDYQNYRYMTKKAIYLAFIASNINDDIAKRKTYVGDKLRPMLKIIPNGKLGEKVSVVVHISAEEATFKLHRFLPEKNSVRPAWFSINTTDEEILPTPHYNSIILHDLTMWRINSEHIKIIKEYPNLRDGIILLKIWLTQRELTKGFEGFNGYIITMFVLYLLSIKKLNTFMSSYQIVRNVWNNLVQIDWCETGLTMNQDEDSKSRVEIYKKYYDCVFLDSTGYHNITANISKATYSWVRREAEICLNHLDSAHAESFHSLFMRKVPFYKAFDYIIWFKNPSTLKNLPAAKLSNRDKLDYGPNCRSQIIKILYDTLKKGLTNRIHQVCILPKDFAEWECTHKGRTQIEQIFIGLELNPEFCFNVVDKGPEANLPEAAEFRQFWGEKSELRRFQDGSIREAVVWSKAKTLAGKRLVCKTIVNYLFTEILHIGKDDFNYIADEMGQFLRLPKVKITHFPYGTGEEATSKVINAFDDLEKNLMTLKDLPLSIHGVQGSSAAFRYTDVFPPLATSVRPDRNINREDTNCLTLKNNIHIVPKYIPPIEMCLQLSTSGKWPDELVALRKTKAAFHLQIAENLRKQYNLRTQPSDSHVDVYKDGFVFRLRVAHQKEIACLKQQVTEDGVIQYNDNDESIELENQLFELPKLSSTLHGLYAQQPSFGPACCLAKRWLSSQLLDNSHIPDVVVELLVAFMYLSPAPYRPPQMPQTAFLRLLEIFARGHWNTDSIIVNFNGEMSKEDIAAVETLFLSSRETLPPLFISTPYDQKRSLWTRKAPTVLILNRISALAKQFLKLFEEQVLLKSILDLKPLFKPPLTEYDCIIQLKSTMLPRRNQAVDADNYPILDWHPYKKHSREKIPVVGFDPVQCLLTELRNGYSEFALFFHDTYGGTVIGVLLKPSALEAKDFKVSNMNCRTLNSNGQLVVNISAMIEDFYILGKGIIESIDIQSQRFSLS